MTATIRPAPSSPSVPRPPHAAKTGSGDDRAEIAERETEETNIDEFVAKNECDMDRSSVDIVISAPGADAVAGVVADRLVLASPLATVSAPWALAPPFASTSPSGPPNTLLNSRLT